jgi:hypothetical protein
MFSRTVTVAATATLIGDQAGHVAPLRQVVKNVGSQTVFLGDATVTTSGGTAGYPLGAGESIVVALFAGDKLYGRVAATTANVSVLETLAEGVSVL